MNHTATHMKTRRRWGGGLQVAALAMLLAMAAPVDAQRTQPLSTPQATAHPAIWPKGHWPFTDQADIDKRVDAILSRMTRPEKVGQTIQADIDSVTPDEVRRYHLGAVLAGGNSAPGDRKWATPRQWLTSADAFYKASTDTRDGGVGIPVLYGVDAVHGDGRMLGATVFPQQSALGATRDPALVTAIAAATARELRASGINWTFAPALSVPQDDRWGRTYEGYSENPALVARYARAAVEGLQGVAGTDHFLDGAHVLASAKHFIGDGSTANGKDQGDARVDERALRDIAGRGYPAAIAAGVQTVMVSFSRWNGVRMSGNRSLLTGVLKQRMGFGGFVVGDWNSHGGIPGCSNTDCPAAMNAGLDMYMAPDSWRGLYRHTLAEVESGAIPMSRLDDAVSRILRVKLRLGLFDMGAPSSQPLGGRFAQIGSTAHRALARRAVRESLVLLKNRHHVLPLDPRRTILVAGPGADNIPQQSGGWTLTWQGTGTTRADFPQARSIWDGIRNQVETAGGHAELAVDGHYTKRPDAAIVVYGESPYAEFRGDLPDLAFSPDDRSQLELIRHLHAQGIPVVSVFLSGRPLWVNPWINASDAFVAAWLPGSEGEGVADVLLAGDDGRIQHDFHGKLAYSWPNTPAQTALNVGQTPYHPLFAYGYGLTYREDGDLARLPVGPGAITPSVSQSVYVERGHAAHGFSVHLADAAGVDAPVEGYPAATDDGSLQVRTIDYKVQEGAVRIRWGGGKPATYTVRVGQSLDLSSRQHRDRLLVTTLRLDHHGSGPLHIGMTGAKQDPATVPVPDLPQAKWVTVGIPLRCLESAGLDLHHVEAALVLRGEPGLEVSLQRAGLGRHADRRVACPSS